MTNTAIHPFRIDVAQSDLDDLHARLTAARWPAPLPGDDWNTLRPRTPSPAGSTSTTVGTSRRWRGLELLIAELREFFRDLR